MYKYIKYMPYSSTKQLPTEEPNNQTLVDSLLSSPQLSDDIARLVAQTFQALADPTRARIVYALTKGEHSVSELTRIAGVSQSATSHQLKSLRDLRIVKFRREGTHIYYSVDDVHVAALFREALHHLAHVMHGLPNHTEKPERTAVDVDT
ncbi:MAG: helix-turn-helix transcriptional regulator [Chloroflexi bacterium AL-W]|nr:helix-turn-helix transcriptional regulator [Chloroflexi bacterium AL-N1]NOK70408.1 helix-turn-helix transcriptional regulator [Chloroflexi bacterium AL-N10]NOK78086.1 helix-turn-helix transcriptional regulator [Chloroflexi bacterium AL-N5]NOK85185.1 helix-turn-helix transcriptional regulator [Chloroflexi bacterium AL-W]NOK92174.1 helix-turn-helix transcriptional regulator [Chloroflexi bacterium AL-N15]